MKRKHKSNKTRALKVKCLHSLNQAERCLVKTSSENVLGYFPFKEACEIQSSNDTEINTLAISLYVSSFNTVSFFNTMKIFL